MEPGVTGVGATFLLKQPPSMDVELWTLIDKHFDRLHLLARFDELSNDEIAEMLASCRSFINAGGANVCAFLDNQAKDLRRVHGRNHWRAVLALALARHAELENWM